MKLIAASLIAGMLLLTACPPPPVGHLCNNTEAIISYCSGWRCQDIASGSTAEVRLTYSEPFQFTIRSAGRELSYSITHRVEIDYARRQADSNCPNCPRYYLQLEPDLRIYILTPELTPPVDRFPAQPTGFPLVPAERAD